MTSQINVVVFGGGNGASTIIQALQPYKKELSVSAVISTSDSGRSSATLRDDMGHIAVADILRVMIAGSSYDYELLKKIFYTERFSSRKEIDHLNIGSLVIALTSTYVGDLKPVLRDMHRIFDCYVSVMPATYEMTTLCASLTNGKTLIGEGTIDEPDNVSDDVLINKVYLDPQGMASQEAIEAIKKANIIITGPGDLYTSSIASLLPQGMYDAIAASSAHIIYVAGNKYTIGGEPAPRTLSARVTALEAYLPRKVDTVVYSPSELNSEQRACYGEKGWGLLDFDEANLSDYTLVDTVFEKPSGGLDKDHLGHLLMKQITAICMS